MKRCITALHEESANLTAFELGLLLKQVTTLYSEKATASTEYFFTIGLDVFTAHILDPLSHSESLEWLIQLCTVNKLWHRLIHQLRHISLSRSHVFGYNNVIIQFPLLTSLRSHRKILAIPSIPALTHHCVHLEIDERAEDDTRTYPYSVKGWSSLRTLKFRSAPSRVCGLRSLTGLTHLEIHAYAFPSLKPLLSKLCKLQSLWIRGFSPRLDLSCLPQLIHLNSDCMHHFVNYTGSGEIHFECDGAGETHFERDVDRGFEAEWDLRNIVVPGCYQGSLVGQWTNGVFTGRARYYYDSEEDTGFFEGQMKDGKRNGYGVEQSIPDTQDVWTYYRGEWANGLRHGIGSIYTRKRHSCETSAMLVSKGLWQNGKLEEIYPVHDC